MASVTVTIPALAQALDLFARERCPTLLREGIAEVVYHRNEKLFLGFSGRLRRTPAGIQGVGTVTWETHSGVFVYQGTWLGPSLTFQSLISPRIEIIDGKLSVRDDPFLDDSALPYYLLKNQVAIENSHAAVKNCPLEFPVVPNHYIRIPGPDGEYLELDVEVSGGGGSVMEVCDRNVHRISRSFTSKNSAGENIDGFLDIWADSQLVRWYKAGEPEVEVPVDLEKFKTWFHNNEIHSRRRNLLQALELQVPLFEKKLPIVSTGTASAP